MIAWNGSTETARTVALGMPLFAQARHVTVLSLEGWGVDGPSGEDLAERLQRHGIEAEAATRSLKPALRARPSWNMPQPSMPICSSQAPTPKAG